MSTDLRSQHFVPVPTLSAIRQTILIHQKSTGDSVDAERVTLHSITETGALIERARPFANGEILHIDLAHHGRIPARIIWTGTQLANCKFDTSLSPSIMAEIEEGDDIVSREEIFAPSIGTDLPPENDSLPQPATPTLGFGQHLRNLRKTRGMTQADLASQLGVSMPAISAWEKGRSQPRDGRLEALAKALSVPVSSLTVPDTFVADASVPLDELLKKCRQKISQAVGASPQRIRISIEL